MAATRKKTTTKKAAKRGRARGRITEDFRKRVLDAAVDWAVENEEHALSDAILANPEEVLGERGYRVLMNRAAVTESSTDEELVDAFDNAGVQKYLAARAIKTDPIAGMRELWKENMEQRRGAMPS